VQTREGAFKLIYAEGKSVPGPILEIGNTNSRYKFPISVKQFMNDWSKQGPAHHCAIGIGTIGSRIEKLGALMNMEVIRIC
jgi:L-arabinose isomerase